MILVLYVVGVTLGVIIGFSWCAVRVADVLRSRLTADPTDEEIELMDKLFYTLSPRPISIWIDRVAKRRIRAECRDEGLTDE